MISRWHWLLLLLKRRLWVRAALFGLAAAVAALLAVVIKPLVPSEAAYFPGGNAVEDILKILASSMLAVATFSLGTMVAAFSAAASTATPRAAQLLIEDRTSQNVLSTFVGAFIFALVGIIALNTHIYGPAGRLVLLAFTVVLLVIILFTFFRWIDYLSRLGQLSETIRRVEEAANDAMQARRAAPHLGCRAMGAVPVAAFPLHGAGIGYVQHLDVEALAGIAEQAKGFVYIARLPGAFVAGLAHPLAWLTWQPSDAEREELCQAFAIGTTRSFDQDPRFGLIVLTEIAVRALSPGINDPGTAIDIIGRLVRVLSVWAKPAEEAEAEEQARFDRVFAPALLSMDMFDDAFGPIARDAAPMLEVGIRLQKALASLEHSGPPEFQAAARHHAAMALRRGLAALAFEEDKNLLRGSGLQE